MHELIACPRCVLEFKEIHGTPKKRDLTFMPKVKPGCICKRHYDMDLFKFAGIENCRETFTLQDELWDQQPVTKIAR